MRFWALTVAIAAAFSPIWAETVSVRSGEHPTFSRLVFEFSEPTEWSFHKDGPGYVLEAAREEVVFDLRNVYRLIPRDRLADITIDTRDNRLRLSVTCACHSEFFEISPGKLVVDIKDGKDGEQAVPLPVATAPPPPAVSIATNLSQRAPLMPLSPLPDAEPIAEPVLPTEPAMPAPQSEASPESIALQAALLQQISRAAAQGLVQANPIELPETAQPDVATPQAPRPENKAAVVRKLDGNLGLRIETSADRDILRPDLRKQTYDGRSCLPDFEVDVVAWGGDLEPTDLLGTRRRALLGEFDAVDPDALLALIRAYLFLGFGREAHALMDSYNTPARYELALRVIASIMDGESVPSPNVLTDQISCDAPVAMWSVLARPELERASGVNTPAVMAAFSALPIHLRRHLGPALSERFLAVGDTKTVASLSNAITRAGGTHGPGVELMQAQLDLATGQHQAADDTLSELVAENGSLSPESLILLLEARNNERLPSSESELGNAAALAFEHAGTEQGQRLQKAWTISNAFSGNFEAAFEVVAHAEGEEQKALVAAIADPLVDRAPDAIFLLHGLGMVASDKMVDLRPETRLEFARRFLALGFTEASAGTLGPRAVDDSDTIRLVRAEIALVDGLPKDALIAMAGITNPAAEYLRARAYAAQQDFARATQHFTQADRSADAAMAAWLDGDWSSVSQKGSAAQQSFATLRQDQNPVIETIFAETVPELGAVRQLSDDAAEARAIFQSLLAGKDQPGA